MSTHVNSPLKSFVLFLVVGALGFAAYEFLWVRKIFAGGDSNDTLSTDERSAIYERIESVYATDSCFSSVRGNISWRPRDDFYRVEITVANGCDDRARDLCREIVELIDREWRVRSSVWAFDPAGRQLASHIK